jgi:sugar-specific transcriptional regulator TrmB
MKNELRNILFELGLNKVEVSVYLSLLELGSGTASGIAQKAELNRVTTYEALKRLSKKGFVKIRAKKNSSVRYFTPEDISTIKEKLEHKKSELDNTIKQVEEMKTEFSAQFSFTDRKPEVFFYDGKEGIRTVLMDTLKQKPKEIVSFASAESLEVGYEEEFLKNYWRKRVSLTIPSRGIIPGTEKAHRIFTQKRNIEEMRQVRFLPKGMYPFKNEVDIYSDSVGLSCHDKGNEHGIIIRSQSIAESLRSVFETLWQLSEESNKK